MRRNLPLILLGAFLAAIQIASVYWLTHREPPVVDELIQLRLDTNDGVIYAKFNRDVTIGMMPHAALQTQTQLERLISEIQRRAAQIH